MSLYQTTWLYIRGVSYFRLQFTYLLWHLPHCILFTFSYICLHVVHTTYLHPTTRLIHRHDRAKHYTLHNMTGHLKSRIVILSRFSALTGNRWVSFHESGHWGTDMRLRSDVHRWLALNKQSISTSLHVCCCKRVVPDVLMNGHSGGCQSVACNSEPGLQKRRLKVN